MRALSLRALTREVHQISTLDLGRYTAGEMREAIDELVSWINEIHGLPFRASTYKRWAERHTPNAVRDDARVASRVTPVPPGG
jgi:hypothetical protein